MSKKRNQQLEEEQKRTRELELQVQALNQRLAGYEAENAPKAARRRKETWVMPNGGRPIPAAPPSDYIQLTPIVQPIPLVPYSTQKQPMFMYDDEDDE